MSDKIKFPCPKCGVEITEEINCKAEVERDHYKTALERVEKFLRDKCDSGILDKSPEYLEWLFVTEALASMEKHG